MSSILALKCLIKYALDYEMPNLKSDKNYIDLINMLKKANVKNKSIINLLILIFEQMFIENGIMKNYEDKQKNNKFTFYCQIKSVPDGIKDDNDFKIIENSLCYAKIKGIELCLIYYLMTLKKDMLLFFKCIESVLSEKDNNYVENKKIIIENINYFTFLYRIGDFFKNDYKDNWNTKYTIDYKDNQFYRKSLSNEEFENFIFKNDEQINVKKLIRFMQRNEKKNENNIINNTLNDIINNKITEEPKNNDYQKQIHILSNKINELEKANKELQKSNKKLQKSNKDLSDKVIELKTRGDDTEKNISSIMGESKRQKSEYTKKIKELYEKNDDFKREMEKLKTKHNLLEIKHKNLEDKNNKLNQEFASSKIESKKTLDELNREIAEKEKKRETLEHNLDLIQGRDSSKFIIDFLYAIIEKDVTLSMKYESKVEAICEKINKEKTNKNQMKFLELLCEFLKKIQERKVNGDKLAHPGLIKKFPNKYKIIENFLFEYLRCLDFYFNFNLLYQAKKAEDITKGIKSIVKAVSETNFFVSLNDFLNKAK